MGSDRVIEMFIPQVFSRLSVRARIILLGVIPVVGFLANGIALTGDAEVGHAFEAVHRNTDVADASRDLKTGLLIMRAATTDFVAHPSDPEVKKFDGGQAMAMTAASTACGLARRGGPRTRSCRCASPCVTSKRASTAGLSEQKSLGYSETEGITAGLIAASNAVENIIHSDLSWVGDVDRANLTLSLLTMRRYEIVYWLTRNEGAERHFLDEVKHFNELFESVDGAPAMKEKLTKQIQAYNSTFAQWVASTEDITPLDSLINHDTESVLPEADKIITAARGNASNAAAELATSRTRTRNVIIWIDLAVVLIGLGCSWRIGRSITEPLEELAGVMKRLANGDNSARPAATHSHDEIGEMARTVVVFRDNMIERERLTGVESETNIARERRGEAVATLDPRIPRLHRASARPPARISGRLENASSGLNEAADAVSSEARTAENSVSAASVNVTTVAGSIEELAVSIGEIAAQATKSTEVAGRAVAESRAPSTPCRSSAMPPTASARSSASSSRSPARPICWRSTPPSRRRAPARPAAASPWSPPR